MPPQNRRYAPEPPPLPKRECPHPKPTNNKPMPPRRGFDFSDIFGLLGGMDSDRILILGLLLLLSGEECDRLLLMALLYILL